MVRPLASVASVRVSLMHQDVTVRNHGGELLVLGVAHGGIIDQALGLGALRGAGANAAAGFRDSGGGAMPGTPVAMVRSVSTIARIP